MESSINSEVARIMRQLTFEYEATQRGLLEVTYGANKDEFIAVKLANMVDIQEELIEIVGSTEANKLLVQAINAAQIS